MVAVASTTGETATVGTSVTNAPAVRVATASGGPVAGMTITFSVASGGGTLSATSAVTDPSGVATAGSWTLGTTAGQNTLTATAPSTANVSPVTITATGTPGSASTVTVTPATVALLPAATQQLAVVVADQYSNAIASPTLSYTSGSGSIATVSTSGLVTAVAPGTTSVVVASGTATGHVAVTVIGHPAGSAIVNATEGGRPFAVAVSGSGVVYVGEQDNAALGRFDLPATAVSGSVAVGNDPTDVAFLPDGSKAFVTNQGSNTVGVIDVATNTQTTTIPIGEPVLRVLSSNDGSKMYVTTAMGHLFIINTSDNSFTSLTLGGTLNGLALNPATSVLYASSTTGTLYEVDLSTNSVTDSVTFGGRPQDLAVSPDGSKLFVANETGDLGVLNANTLASITSVSAAADGFGMALTRDGTQLYVTRPSHGDVLVLDATTYAVLQTISGGTPRRVAFDRSGLTGVITNEAGYVSFVR